MSAIAQQCQLNYVSEGDYLEGEKHSEVRHEYVDGQVYAMAGTTKRHNEIAVNISTALRIASRGSLCKVYSSAVKVRAIGRKAFYYQNSRNAPAFRHGHYANFSKPKPLLGVTDVTIVMRAPLKIVQT